MSGLRGTDYRQSVLCDQKIQCFAKSVASEAVQSPLGFSFMLSHQASLPTSGAQPVSIETNAARQSSFFIVGHPGFVEISVRKAVEYPGRFCS